MNNLRRRRLAAGMSQYDLADKLRISQQRISSMESGRRRISVEMLGLLSKALGCEAVDICPPVGSVSASVTESERELLLHYRSCTDAGRATLAHVAASLAHTS